MARKVIIKKATTRGRDLTVDSVGTVQLLDENDLNQLFNTGLVKYDKKIYSDYKRNLKRQKIFNSLVAVMSEVISIGSKPDNCTMILLITQ